MVMVGGWLRVVYLRRLKRDCSIVIGRSSVLGDCRGGNGGMKRDGYDV